ncbi:hypothetical protein [Methylomicrobium lacus]|uniref:hypothetical protein n=1 Tax=Methylomicrobium lacus TaxID=136992 RepID=UPI00045EB5E4|nr:hypothetical protein [Methylomicrobium lacus]
MLTTPSISLTILKKCVEMNFYLSVIVLIASGILSLSDNGSIFEFHTDLYGPLANNLRMMLVYLALTEIFLCIGCFFSGNTHYFMLVGLSLTLMSGSLQVYSLINAIEVDPNLSLFFAYTGVSHLAFGLSAHLLRANRPHIQTRSPRSS